MSGWRGILIGVLGVAVGCGSVEEASDGAPGPDGTSSDGASGPDARPADAAPDVKRVFVTSVRVPGNFGGLAMADQICTNLVTATGVGGTYLAWLSDGSATGSPAARFPTRHPGPYVLVDGTMVAASWTDLTDGTLLSAIRLDEAGQPAAGGSGCFNNDVWSATRNDGSPGGPDVCQQSPGSPPWATTAFGSNGGVGTITADSRWSYGDGCVTSCGEALPLYCFEQ